MITNGLRIRKLSNLRSLISRAASGWPRNTAQAGSGYTLTKIICGGQTGADTGALLAARQLDIETGGFAPRGWLTENGPQEENLRRFGLIECDEPGYPPRTRANVLHSDGTLLVGNDQIGGTRLTDEIATELRKPLFRISFEVADESNTGIASLEEFRSWLDRHRIEILNVAGNRESEKPGIAEFTRAFLINAMRK